MAIGSGHGRRRHHRLICHLLPCLISSHRSSAHRGVHNWREHLLNGFAPRYLCHFDRNNPAHPALLLPWHHCLFLGSRFGNLATFAGNSNFVGDDLRRQGYLHAVGDPSGYQNEPANRNLAPYA